MKKQEYLQGLICNSISAGDIVCGLLEHYIFVGSTTVQMNRDLCIMYSAEEADEAWERVQNAVLILERKGISTRENK